MLPQPSADPIISRLRPRSVQEILDQAFRLYRKYFLTFLAITAIVFVPTNAITQAVNVVLQGSNAQIQRQAQDGTYTSSTFDSSSINGYVGTLFVLLGVLSLVSLLGSLLLSLPQGALTSAVGDSYLDRPVSMGRAYKNMLGHVGPLLGAISLQVLIAIGLFIPFGIVLGLSILGAAGSSDRGSGAVAGICFSFVLIIPALIAYAYVRVRISLMVPAIMLENLGPVQALRRSWGLVKNFWWRTFGLTLLLGVLQLVVSAGPAALLAGLVAVVSRSLDPVLNSIITGVVTVATSALFIPLQLVATTLYYFDQRVRKEGFDIETALDRRFAPPPHENQYDPAGRYMQPTVSNGGMSPPMLATGSAYSPPAEQPGAYQEGVSTSPVPSPTYPSTGTPTIYVPAVPARTGPSTEPLNDAAARVEAAPENAEPPALGFATPSISEQASLPNVDTGYPPETPRSQASITPPEGLAAGADDAYRQPGEG